ncbi:phosphoribosylglycinamide formyltransferase [Bacillaceae bacterium S4-13-56]
MKKLAIFASGSGSNFEAIVKDIHLSDFPAEIAVLVCDKMNAKVIDRANQYGVPVMVFAAIDFASKEAYEKVILDRLRSEQVEWIFLAGYMRLIGPTLLKAYEGRIVNIHPSLLPSFPGKDAIQQTLDSEVKVTGVTVHFVDEGMDTGPAIAQEATPRFSDDTYESLHLRIQQIEHTIYPKVIRELVTKEDTKWVNVHS